MYEDLITLYGRKPVLEVLSDTEIEVFRLHLADSNVDSDIMREIASRAAQRQIEVRMHSKKALSRISKNGRQDQGVAVDVKSGQYRSINTLPAGPLELLAVDRVTNPQNLGMIIRSVAASPMHGLLLPKQGCARIDPLVHKASAGTLFKAAIYHCDTLAEGLAQCQHAGCEIVGLSGDRGSPINELSGGTSRRVFVVGNESEGLSASTIAACDLLVSIPLAGHVESLNVANAATLVAFRTLFAAPD